MERPAYQNVTIQTIDQAVYDWFDKTVDAHVANPNQSRSKVPVKLASGERWLTASDKKAFRDDNGVLILPIISIRRTGIDPVNNMTALGIEGPNYNFAKRISRKTNDLMNLNAARDPLRRTPPKPVVYEVYSVPFPNSTVFTYEVQIQTQYIMQMNSIIEKLFHQLDIRNSFVAPFQNDGRHPPLGQQFEKREKMDKEYVVGIFDSNVGDASNFEEFTDQERIIRYSTTIQVPAVLRLDTEGEAPAVKVERTAFGLGFSDEKVTFVTDPAEADKIFGPR